MSFNGSLNEATQSCQIDTIHRVNPLEITVKVKFWNLDF